MESRELKQHRRRRRRQRERQKGNSFGLAIHHTFLYFSLLLLHDYNVKNANLSRFLEDVNIKIRQPLSFSFPVL